MTTKTDSRKRSHSVHVLDSIDYASHSGYIEYDNSSPKSGKWSVEEEQFANRLIHDFELGILSDCEEGCTLRSYLARKLNCAPMRISKKYAGQCIGKHVYTRRTATQEDVDFPAAKYPKLTFQNETLPTITFEPNLFRIHSNSTDSSTESFDETSSNEYDGNSDIAEAAEWKDVLSFFCGEFNDEEPDLLFDFRESWR